MGKALANALVTHSLRKEGWERRRQSNFGTTEERGNQNCLTAGDGGDDGDFGVGREGSGETSGVADIFFADENVDVFADLALLVDDAIANAGMKGIQE